MKTITILALSLLSIASFGQINITPYLSAGYVNHLSRNGLNLELGVESEFFRRADLTVNYRHMNAGGEITVSAVSANISYVIINRNSHRLMIGPGFSYGKYIRESGYPGYDKNYTSAWFDWVRIRYDYTLKDRCRLGLVAALSGEDGDGSTYVGLIVGLKL